MAKCPVQISHSEWNSIQQCEAVIVVEYSNEGRDNYARIEAWGDKSDMDEQASEYRIAAVPVGHAIVQQVVMLVADMNRDQPKEPAVE